MNPPPQLPPPPAMSGRLPRFDIARKIPMTIHATTMPSTAAIAQFRGLAVSSARRRFRPMAERSELNPYGG